MMGKGFGLVTSVESRTWGLWSTPYGSPSQPLWREILQFRKHMFSELGNKMSFYSFYL